MLSISFFFNDTATTEIYTLSLHDALPIYVGEPLTADVPEEHGSVGAAVAPPQARALAPCAEEEQGSPHDGETLWVQGDRKSTRLNSSHANISYAVFCLKKKQIVKNSALPP